MMWAVRTGGLPMSTQYTRYIEHTYRRRVAVYWGACDTSLQDCRLLAWTTCARSSGCCRGVNSGSAPHCLSILTGKPKQDPGCDPGVGHVQTGRPESQRSCPLIGGWEVPRQGWGTTPSSLICDTRQANARRRDAEPVTYRAAWVATAPCRSLSAVSVECGSRGQADAVPSFS